MSRSALILAAHGSRVEPSANAPLWEHSRRVGELRLFDEVTPAFHQGEPAFSTVLDQLAAEDVTVIPVMSSAGYFSDVVLRRELKKNARYPEVRVRQTQPVGTHPRIVPLVVKRVRDRLREFRLDPRSTSLVIAAHGTERYDRSRLAAVRLADSVRGHNLCAEVLTAFLDEEPGVDAVCARATQSSIVVVPFLIGAGPHATRDIPDAVGLRTSDHTATPFAGRVGDRFIVCDAPVGTDPGIIEILGALARAASSGQEEKGR